MLAAAAAMLASLLGWWAMNAIASASLPIRIPIHLNVQLDLRVWVFMALVASIAGAVAGLLPALQSARTDILPVLRGDGRSTGIRGRRFSLRDVLVATQIAVTTLLLITATLLGRNLARSWNSDLGYNRGGLAIVSADPEMAGYDRVRSGQFFDRAVTRVRAMAGVQSVATASRLPLSLNSPKNTSTGSAHFPPGWTSSKVTMRAL